MPTFLVTDLGPLSHDGATFTSGEQVTIEELAAAPLLDLGVITPAPDHGGKPKPTAKDAG